MSNCINDDRGSYTIEAALVFSVLILTLSALILSFMLMHHKIVLTKTASAAAQKAAGMFSGMRTSGGGLDLDAFPDFPEGIISSETVAGEDSLIEKTAWLQAEVGSGSLGPQERVFKTIQLTVYEELSRTVRKPETTTVVFNYVDKLLSGEIRVTITQEIKIPLGPLKQCFDGKETLTLVGTGVAPLLQQAEYISNIDLVLEYADKLKVTDIIKRMRSWIKP